MILVPLYFRTIITFDGALNFHLSTEEYDSGSSDFESDFRFLGIMLNVSGIADLYDRLGIFRRAWFDVARFLVWWLGAGTHGFGSFDFMFLRHDLFTLDFAFFETITAGVGALGPLSNFPANWTVEHIAVLTIGWWRLRTHTIRHNHGIFSTTCHLMYALDFASFNAYATGLRTGRIVGIIPTRWARTIIAGSYTSFGLGFWSTQEWRNNTTIIFPDTIDNEFFDSAQTAGTARRIALFSPDIGFPRL